jgi:succinyl-CoA synthetase beta subunit
LYVCERVYNRRETYFAILMDRSCQGPAIVASSEGGVEIETVAMETPDAIIKEPIDIMTGLLNEQTERVAKAIGFPPSKIPSVSSFIISSSHTQSHKMFFVLFFCQHK